MGGSAVCEATVMLVKSENKHDFLIKLLTLLCTQIHTAVVTNGRALSMIVERCLFAFLRCEEVSHGCF